MSNADNFAGRRWTLKEMEHLYKSRINGVPYAVIARELDRTIDSLSKKFLCDTNWSKFDFYDPEFEKNRGETLADAATKRDLSINKNLDKYRLQADVIGDKLCSVARTLPTVPPPVYKPSKNEKKRTDEDMVLVLSDLHIGHEHTSEETGGLSEYNFDIYLERMENLKKAITDIYELHSKLYKIPRLHILSLGDIVDGANTAGAWSPVWINLPILDQVMYGYRSIADFIYYTLGMFQEVNFYALYGNHGRIAPSGAEKKYNNFDLFCYKYLETEFKENKRVKMHTTKSWWMMPEIQNHKFLLVHGDDMKSKNPPILGLMDLEKRMAGLTGVIPDYTVCGHFHNCSEYTTHSGKVLMNGSFVGGDVYSLSNNMPGNIPEQKLFGVHPSVGITWNYNINLNHKRN